jgi:uncharacterized protein (DUF305 family)
LDDVEGTAADRLYLEYVVAHHVGPIAMARTEALLDGTASPGIRAGGSRRLSNARST